MTFLICQARERTDTLLSATYCLWDYASIFCFRGYDFLRRMAKTSIWHGSWNSQACAARRC